MVMVGLHAMVRGVSDHVSEERQHLHEKRNGIGLRVRHDSSYYFAGKAVVGSGVYDWRCVFLVLELRRFPVGLGFDALMIARLGATIWLDHRAFRGLRTITPPMLLGHAASD